MYGCLEEFDAQLKKPKWLVRNLYVTDAVGQLLVNKEDVIWKGREGNSYCKLERRLPEVCSSVL